MPSFAYMRYFIFILLVTLFLVATNLVQAQAPLATTPIVSDHNRTIIPLKIDGVPLNFLLDTGASTSLIFKNDRTDKLTNLIHKNGVLVKFPAFRKTSKAVRVAELPFEMEDGFSFILHDILFLNDPQFIDQISGAFDGIVGREIFKQFTIEIDPLAKQLSLHDPEVNLSKHYPMYHNLATIDKSPQVILASQFPWERIPTRKRLLLDTGYPGGMVIWSRKHFKNVTTKNEREQLSGENSGIFLRMDLQFNRLLFQRIPIFFGNTAPPTKTRTDGLLGAGLFIQYNHVFDFKRKKLFLRPLRTEDGKTPPIALAGIYTPNNETFITKDYRPKIPSTLRIIINADNSVHHR